MPSPSILNAGSEPKELSGLKQGKGRGSPWRTICAIIDALDLVSSLFCLMVVIHSVDYIPAVKIHLFAYSTLPFV